MSNVVEFPNQPEPTEEFVTAPDIVAGARISYRQLDYWTRTGLLVPSNLDPGTGYHRHYAPEQLDRAKAVSALLRAGLALPSIRKSLSEILAVGALTYGPVTITYTPEEDPA